jgi:hypothetical protein
MLVRTRALVRAIAPLFLVVAAALAAQAGYRWL